MNARQDLLLSFHFILRVTSKGRERLREDDFDKMADLFMEKLDAYVEAARPCVVPTGNGATCPSPGGALK